MTSAPSARDIHILNPNDINRVAIAKPVTTENALRVLFIDKVYVAAAAKIRYCEVLDTAR